MSTQPVRLPPTARVAGRERGGFAAGRVGVAVALLVLGTLALRSAWVGFAAWPFLLAAGILGLGVLWLARRSGVSFAIAVLLAVAVPLVALVVLGRRDGLTLVASVADSVPILLTSTYPAPVTGMLLGPGLVIAWAAGAVLGFGLHSRRFLGHPLVAALVLLVSAALLTAGRADPWGLIALAVVLVLLLQWAWVARVGGGMGSAGQPARAGGVPRAAVPAAALAVLALLFAYLPLGAPFQPRELVQPPVTHLEEPNPLPMLGHWARNPELEVLRRTGDNAPLRLVVLPDYDGVSFGSRSSYLPLGTTEQPVLPPGRFQVTVDAGVTWTTTTRWLPSPGQPVAVSVPEALGEPVVDIDNGSMLVRNLPADGVVSYAVTGRIDAARMAEVEGAGVAEEPRYLALPALPPEFVGYAREVTAGSESYLQMAQALERAVSSGRVFDANAPGGSSLGRLSEFLFAPRERGGRAGTSEQFATAYALLARSVGLPTRVVVGFGDGQPLPGDPDTRVVRGSDALAWPEVYFVGHGWVAFDPTPSPDGAQTPRPGRVAPPTPRADRTVQPTPPPSAATDRPDGGAVSPAAWSLLALLLVLVPVAGLLIARRRRTRAQRDLGTVGAWLRVEDAMTLAGWPPDRTRSATERAAALGVPPAVTLATHAETAAFAPGPVPAAQESSELADEVVRRLRAAASPWRRAVWAISPEVWWRRDR
ncbi:transglutaminaseTgpA domain-containing protein [Granulicoccus sp. GXG6511]|uniref:transglutaminase-like domain-containing protein n=1 Tax=Granulicoccus sp. GXG6511 TaxID=3381351 RepID=UPI003D7D516D